jgi:hypothetical protein
VSFSIPPKKGALRRALVVSEPSAMVRRCVERGRAYLSEDGHEGGLRD